MSETTSTKERKRRSKGELVKRVLLVFAIWAAVGLGIRLAINVFAAEPATTAFNQTWQRTDDPVALGLVDRTWMWGPDGFTAALSEEYTEGPGGERTVQYFDKSRMEDNGFRATAPWDVTNGLLVVELVTGQMQVGDNDFEQRPAAEINVAGDADDPTGVQYAGLAALLDAPALAGGQSVTQRVDRSGNVADDPSLASFGVTAAYRLTEPGIDHQVASPFWEFINANGTVYEDGGYVDALMFLSPFYATGYPITEAYWANVKVGGAYQDVLLQCFERRCLTYTPGNTPGWQVEAGNVGQHYYSWRYGAASDEPGSDGTQTPPADSTAEASPTDVPGTGTAEPSATAPADPSTEPTISPTTTQEPVPSPTAEPGPTATATQEPAPRYSFAGKFGEAYDPDTRFDELSGIGVGPDGSIYVLEEGDPRVQQYTSEGLFVRMLGESGSGAGHVDHPRAIAFDKQGNIYVSDWPNGRIVKYGPKGNYRGQIGSYGFGDGELSTVYGIAFDSQGYLYVVDTNSDRVQKFDRDGNFIAKWDKGTGAGPGQFSNPLGLAIDAKDIVYVVDSYNNRVQKFDTDGTYLDEWGTGGSGNGQFSAPTGIAISASGVVYVADTGNNRIQAFQTDGTHAGSWDGTGSHLDPFRYPEGVAVDRAGNVYVTDPNANRVQKFSANGAYLDGWLGGHRGRLEAHAAAMTLDEDGNVYIADAGRVQKFDPAGRFIWEATELNTPVDLEVLTALVASPDGYLYVADGDLNKIVKFTLDGDFVQEWSAADNISGLTLDDDGDLYSMDISSRRLRKLSPSGSVRATWDMSGLLSAPIDIAIDGDRLYVADMDPTKLSGVPTGPADLPAIKVFDLDDRSPLGAIGGPDQFDAPFGLGLDGAGYVYVADVDGDTVQQFAPDGTYLATIGGPGNGNGQFRTPTAVQIASDGTLYVLDTHNFRVQIFR